MTLVNLKEALSYAVDGEYAIGAFNLTGEDMLYGILDAAVQENSPVIVSIYEGHLPYLHFESFMKLVVSESQAVNVPVVIFLDHATQMKTIYRAFQVGFTSVMYDGSLHDYSENISNTKHVCDIAHTLGISVEAELGKISHVEHKGTVSKNRREFMTDPHLVPEFIKKTDIDALAISIGTVHGYYVGKSEIDFELLGMIKDCTETPLVLHGGTGLKDEEFLKAISLGIRKINYGTGIFATSADTARKILNNDPQLIIYQDVCMEIRKAVCNRVASYMRLWSSSGKSWLGKRVH